MVMTSGLPVSTFYFAFRFTSYDKHLAQYFLISVLWHFLFLLFLCREKTTTINCFDFTHICMYPVMYGSLYYALVYFFKEFYWRKLAD